MKYRDLVAELARDSKFTQADVRGLLLKMANIVVSEIKDTDSDGVVTVSNLGTFKRTFVKERFYSIGGNFGVAPAHYKVVFNPAVSVAEDIASVVVK